MQPHMYAAYPYPNGAPMPVRYMVPNGYRQNSPPFANQAFDPHTGAPANVRPPQNMPPPVRYPPGYGPRYAPPTVPPSTASSMGPGGASPRPPLQRKQSEQLQPPQPYYYNPYGPNGGNPSLGPPKPAAKKGAKEFKETAFTIAPDGGNNETIKGLVSNNDINELLKHKGTKVKVSKIYRITKTKPEVQVDDSSDEDLLPPPPPSRPPRAEPSRAEPPRAEPSRSKPPSSEPPRSQRSQRRVSSSSSDSHCSTCSNCSCSDCRDRRPSHADDDCPDCIAQRNREHTRRSRR